MKVFDYIIAGSGTAGLNLAYVLLDMQYREKSILIIDKDLKVKNDRTWCFWEKQPNKFEHLVKKSWKNIQISGKSFDKTYTLKDYTYKMIRGIDFYEYVLSEIRKAPHITLLTDEITSIDNDGIVKTKQSEFKAHYVFDSTFNYQTDELKTPNTLLQHFKGLIIETPTAKFDAETARYMDFSVPQHGDCRFGYVLPFFSNKALVEYTLFNQELLAQEEYDEALTSYLKSLGIEEYKILETEYGIIPMTDYPFTIKKSDHVFHIGIKGGFAKPSTGYSFKRAQEITSKIAQNLANGHSPDTDLPYQKKRFKKYDATILEVLAKKQLTGEQIFTQLFEKNGCELMFKFLDEETSFTEELKIMSSTPMLTFGKAFMNNLAS